MVESKDMFISNPKEIKILKDLIQDSYSDYTLDNSFCVFKSINNIYCLICSNEKRTIISYDIINNRKINEILKSHEKYITNLRYYLDMSNKRDLIFSISADDNNLKLWNVRNFEKLLDLKNINASGSLYSSCFLNYHNEIYIISSNCNFIPELIKVFDMKGKKIKELKNSKDSTYFIDVYYDDKSLIYYIITGNQGYVKAYDFNKNEIYKKYCDNADECHDSLIVINQNEVFKLISSSKFGNIRIWDFNSGMLINTIKVSNYYLVSICLWNDDYLFAGCGDKTLKLIDLQKGKTIKKFSGQNSSIITIKKLIIPNYGECLITQGYEKNSIKLWINNIF